MKSMVIYDSSYGNTRRVAKHIATACKSELLMVSEVGLSDVEDIDVLIVGSPTQGGRPTRGIQEFFKSLPADSLKGVKVAAFDTRMAAKEQRAWLRHLMRLIGYAAPRIVVLMKAKGGHAVAAPKGFIVKDKEGPLKAGELERAAEWGRMLHRA